jgi:hypothetical protein
MKYLLTPFLLLACACPAISVQPIVTEPPPSTLGVILDATAVLSSDGRIFCSGVFVENYVLTAAHCIDPENGETQVS